MRSHIGWRGKRNIFYKGVETSPSARIVGPDGGEIPYRLGRGMSANEDVGPEGW